MNTLNEVWVEVKGFGKYSVSNLSNVRNNKTGRYLKGRIDRDGYYNLILYSDTGYKNFKVHQLVALHFLPNPFNYTQINHKDEIRSNNIVDNLEWCTSNYNNNYGERNHRLSLAKRNKGTSLEVIQMNTKGDVLQLFPSLREVERRLGYNHSNISLCCRGKCKQAYGYLWKFKENINNN